MRILSLDGGGYLGLATASFLERTEAHFNAPCHSNFDFFAGTSTGAIIALALAIGKKASEVVSLYQNLGSQVFPPDRKRWMLSRIVRSATTAKYDSQPLMACLSEVFGNTTLGDIADRGKFVLIPAYSLTNGRPRVFKTDHSSALTRDNSYRLADIAMASAAAPTYLPLVNVPDPMTKVPDLLCDGGVFANNPGLLAYTEVIAELGQSAKDVSLLSAATPRPEMALRASVLGEVEKASRAWGQIAWMRKGKLTDVFINAAAEVAHQSLRRLTQSGGAAYERFELRNADSIPMDSATADSSEALRSLGSDLAVQNSTRERLRPFFTQGK